jgi:hypothetical protein
MTATLRNRIEKIEDRLGGRRPEGECPDPVVTGVLDDDQEEPGPDDGTGRRCPNCGGRHIIRIVEEEVPEDWRPTEKPTP